MTRRTPTADGPGALAHVFAELLRNARRTGEDRSQQLRSGARIAVRCRDGIVTMTLARAGAPVGDVEIATFRRHCAVPETAVRLPESGQRAFTDDHNITWNVLAFRWPDVEAPTPPPARYDDLI